MENRDKRFKKRKCAGCGEYKFKDELIKITKNHKDGSIVLDPNSKIFGRSVYLCYNQSCIDSAFKKNKLKKILKTKAEIEKSAFCTIMQNR